MCIFKQMYQTLLRSGELSESKVILLDIKLFRSCKLSESMEFRHKATEAEISLKASQVNLWYKDAIQKMLLQRMFYSEVVNYLNVWYIGIYHINRWCLRICELLRSIVFWSWYKNQGTKVLIHWCVASSNQAQNQVLILHRVMIVTRFWDEDQVF